MKVLDFINFEGDYLLICDIGASKGMTRIENEELILENNKLQMKWVEIMRPRKVIYLLILLRRLF
jgi:hypothetical protein